MTKPVYLSTLSFAQSLRVISWVRRQWDIDKLINVNKPFLLARIAARMFMKIRPMEINLLNSASDFLYDTHFYFNILSLAAIISARWLHCHKHGKCYSIVSCSPLILIGAHFLSLAINQLHDCVQRSMLSRIRTLCSAKLRSKSNFTLTRVLKLWRKGKNKMVRLLAERLLNIFPSRNCLCLLLCPE